MGRRSAPETLYRGILLCLGLLIAQFYLSALPVNVRAEQPPSASTQDLGGILALEGDTEASLATDPNARLTFTGVVQDTAGSVPAGVDKIRIVLRGGDASGPKTLLWGTFARADGSFFLVTDQVYDAYYLEALTWGAPFVVVGVQPGPGAAALSSSSIRYSRIPPGTYEGTVFTLATVAPSPTPTIPPSATPAATPTAAATATPAAVTRLRGFVQQRHAGTLTPASGVVIEVWSSNTPEQLETFIDSKTTDSGGFYNFYLPAAPPPFYHIRLVTPSGLAAENATSALGTVITPDHILIPAPGARVYADNNFILMPAGSTPAPTPPTPRPTPTQIATTLPTPTQDTASPSPTASPTATASGVPVQVTPTPSPTASPTDTPRPTSTPTPTPSPTSTPIPAARIRGHISLQTASDLQPLPGILLQVWSSSDPDYPQELIATRATDGSGFYNFYLTAPFPLHYHLVVALPEGLMGMWADSPGGVIIAPTHVRIDLPLGRVYADNNFILVPPPPPTSTATATPIPSATPTFTPTPTATPTSTLTPTPTATFTPTSTPTPSPTASPSPTPTSSPTATTAPTSIPATPTLTPIPTDTPIPQPEHTHTPTPHSPPQTTAPTALPTLVATRPPISTPTEPAPPSPTPTRLAPSTATPLLPFSITPTPRATPTPETGGFVSALPTITINSVETAILSPISALTTTPKPTTSPTPAATPLPRSRLVVALEKRPGPSVGVGQVKQLTLMARNYGELPSDVVTFTDKFPAGWKITAASATKGLVSFQPGEVSVALGRLQPGEQIIILVTIEATQVSERDSIQHCVALTGAGVIHFRACAYLPTVHTMDSITATSRRHSGPPSASNGSTLELTMLDDPESETQKGQSGAILVIRNNGDSPVNQAYVYIELDKGWRLTDALTQLGLVSVVDHTAVVRVGRVDPSAPIAVTLRGWAVRADTPGFCSTLVADGQPRQSQCYQFQIADQETPLLTANLHQP